MHVQLLQAPLCRGQSLDAVFYLCGQLRKRGLGPRRQERSLVGDLQRPLGQAVAGNPVTLDSHEDAPVAFDQVLERCSPQLGEQTGQCRPELLVRRGAGVGRAVVQRLLDPRELLVDLEPPVLGDDKIDDRPQTMCIHLCNPLQRRKMHRPISRRGLAAPAGAVR
jgi:hypothetical protein